MKSARNYDPNIVDTIRLSHVDFDTGYDRLVKLWAIPPLPQSPLAMAIRGETGTGKSRLLATLLREHPAVWKPEGKNVPLLIANTLSKPTPLQILQRLLTAIGDPKPDKGPYESRFSRLVDLCNECGVRMIALDNYHRVVDKGTDRLNFETSDMLVDLLDALSVHFVVCGLPYVYRGIHCNEQLLRRFQAPADLRRFDWLDDVSRLEFIDLVSTLVETLEDFSFPEADAEMALRFYLASGGLLGLVIYLVRQSVRDAISRNSFRISMKDLLAAHRTSVWSLDGGELASPFSSKFGLANETDLVAGAKLLMVRDDDSRRTLIGGKGSKKAPAREAELSDAGL